MTPEQQSSIPSGTTEKTGYTFVANGMQPYNVGETNAQTIYELTENMYITGPVARLTIMTVDCS